MTETLAPKWDHARGIYVASETVAPNLQKPRDKCLQRDASLAKVLSELQRDAVRSGRERMVC